MYKTSNSTDPSLDLLPAVTALAEEVRAAYPRDAFEARAAGRPTSGLTLATSLMLLNVALDNYAVGPVAAARSWTNETLILLQGIHKNRAAAYQVVRRLDKITTQLSGHEGCNADTEDRFLTARVRAVSARLIVVTRGSAADALVYVTEASKLVKCIGRSADLPTKRSLAQVMMLLQSASSLLSEDTPKAAE